MISEKADDDIVETEASLNLIDPISKKTMTNPVKNTYCNHTYDLDTITNFINAKKNRHVM